VVPKLHPEEGRERIRTWSSGPELIRLAETGCDLCSFIRKHIEKVSTANVQRIYGLAAIVLRDCYSEIILDANLHSRKHGLYLKIRKPFYDSEFRIEPTLSSSQLSIHETQHNPVFRACELLEACMLSENDEHNDCALDKVDTSNKAASLPRRLLDLSYNDNIVTLDVQACIATARATVDELSKYCTLSYRWGGKPPDCMLSTQFIDERVTSFVNMPQTFKDAIIVARGLKIRFLWIDALCIIQPSAHGNFSDWNAEGPRMWLVYQNAICTIAATCSDNPNTGFL
jgi:hypothetical protein